MKIITLNTWGGKLLEPLLKFLKEQSENVDIFCLQEVYSSLEDRKIGQVMQSNLFERICSLMQNHNGYFVPHLQSYDLEGKTSFKLQSGLALFVKKSLQIINTGDIYIYREGCELIDGDIRTIPRNLQYLQFKNNDQEYLIGHFHGVWYPKSKQDNKDRIEQSRRIKRFFEGYSCKKILCGDFNLLPTTKSIKILEEGNRNLITEFKIETTRNEHYGRKEKHADYILVSPDVDVVDFKVIKTIISDHYPLILEFE